MKNFKLFVFINLIKTKYHSILSLNYKNSAPNDPNICDSVSFSPSTNPNPKLDRTPKLKWRRQKRQIGAPKSVKTKSTTGGYCSLRRDRADRRTSRPNRIHNRTIKQNAHFAPATSTSVRRRYSVCQQIPPTIGKSELSRTFIRQSAESWISKIQFL